MRWTRITNPQTRESNVKRSRVLTRVLLGSSLLLAIPLHAEIYKSEGPDGTPTFSDAPLPGSQEVQLPEENIADPVEVIPALESVTEPASRPPQSSTDEATGNAEAFRPFYKEEYSGEKRKEILNAEQRDEVLNADERHEVLDAAERDEVGEATSRHEVQDAGARDEVRDAGARREVGHEP